MSNLYGGQDLSGLGKGDKAYPVFVQADESKLREYIELSNQIPILVLFSSNSDADQLKSKLSVFINEAQGRLLGMELDIVNQPQLAQAFGIEQSPTVVALLSGQPAPLFQGDQPEQQISGVINQLLQAASQNGVNGSVNLGEEPKPDQSAYISQLISQGDLDTAEKELEKALQIEPNDEQLISMKRQIELMKRMGDVDFDKALTIESEDPDLLRQKSDALLVRGDAEQALDNLLDRFPAATDEDKEKLRNHVLELFELIGNSDPLVLKARAKLASLLF
ncbi:MAG: tetratricopeptide repeat protein [Microbacteriaceae bacterium]|jgi:putative thioredoxin|nr:tetratricopeptide repeat protein [Microbacteriaceae bacterium]MDR9443664.1 tetratricopeptide repeat protein [Microbacteriaceae bacterium]